MYILACVPQTGEKAITATAHKLAVIIYNMLTKFEAYKPYINERSEEKDRLIKLKDIDRLIKKYKIGAEEVCF